MGSLILPPALKKGSKVAIVAPARSVTREQLNASFRWLTEYGMNVVTGHHVFGSHHIFSGTDDERAADLQWALNDSDIRAVFCARGGYGCMRLTDQVDFTILKSQPKWIIGYSDITVLHNHINQLGVATLHGTMPVHFDRDPESTQRMLNVLLGKCEAIEWKTQPGQEVELKGTLCGGNLSLLYALQGSISLFQPENAIVFLEDVDEYLYHVDRMIISLSRSGYFNKARALLCGGFDDMKDNEIPFGLDAQEIISQHLSNKYISPSFPGGHRKKNFPLIMGAEYHLTSTGNIHRLEINRD